MREPSVSAEKAEEVALKLSSNIMKSDDLKPQEVASFFMKEVSQRTAGGGIEGPNDPETERRAYEKGFAAGEEAGRILGLRKLDPTEKILLKLIEAVNHLKTDILGETKEDIFTISLAIAERIIGQTVHENPEIIQSNIQKAIKKIGKTEKLVIRLHPEDLEILTRDADDVIHTQNKNIAFRFEADISLSPGDYIVEGEERMIDGRQKNQLKILETLLRAQEK